ncbi:uncharacterized protein LOC116301917 isoform X2 [Actinia tenebrosa]|uniref:Uncharacterized protein LOC116301917 isoform X2 n=1 Tax=Actinia tenebrosa TaxID=6105 RepID=A0A6P8IJI8_ACTTE|nr:uncharacterized protein LOC116301917 isoform X2 [Actinia tenebrosa]
MAVNIHNSKDFSFDNLYQTEKEVILFCSKYNNRPLKATVHDLMRDVEQFSTSSILKSEIPLHVQCRWLTAIANQPCLVRVFSGELNPNGEHIVTQVTIICKNLMTTIEGSLTADIESNGLCEIVACSSLCYIANYWVSIIPQKSTPFVLLALKTFLNILEKARTDVTPFLNQVAADSLTQILHVPILWLGILSDKERLEIVARLLNILQHFFRKESRDNITMIKLLQAINMDSLLRTLLGIPDLIRTLLGLLLELLPPVATTDDAPFLEVRWLSLCILWRFLHMMGITPDVNTKLTSMIDHGCSDPDQVQFLHQLVSAKYKDYLNLGRFKIENEGKSAT